MCLGLDDQGVAVWISGRGMRFFSFQKHSDRLWGPPVQWEAGALLLGHEANCSSPSSAEVKNKWSSTFILMYLHGVHRDIFCIQ